MTDTIIPEMFWESLNREPACMTLRAAVADWLEENDDPDGAECLRWSIEKGRVPFDTGWTCFDKDIHDIPAALYDAAYGMIEGDLMGVGHHKAFIRLIIRWKHTTREQRDEFWRWTPCTN